MRFNINKESIRGPILATKKYSKGANRVPSFFGVSNSIYPPTSLFGLLGIHFPNELLAIQVTKSANREEISRQTSPAANTCAAATPEVCFELGIWFRPHFGFSLPSGSEEHVGHRDASLAIRATDPHRSETRTQIGLNGWVQIFITYWPNEFNPFLS